MDTLMLFFVIFAVAIIAAITIGGVTEAVKDLVSVLCPSAPSWPYIPLSAVLSIGAGYIFMYGTLVLPPNHWLAVGFGFFFFAVTKICYDTLRVKIKDKSLDLLDDMTQIKTEKISANSPGGINVADSPKVS